MESHLLHCFVSFFYGITLSVSLIHVAVCAGSSFFMAVYYSIVYVLIPYFCPCYWSNGLPKWLSSKKKSCLQCRRRGFDPWVGSIPWRRKWQPTLVFLPGESHGQLTLAGYSPWGLKTVGQDLTTKKQQLVQRCGVMERGLYH